MKETKLWRKLLSESPKGSVLMGGAVVDALFNVPPKDYDIFFSYKPGQPQVIPNTWKLTPVNFNDPVWLKEHEEQYKQGVDANGVHPIATVNEYLVDDEHLVQLIGVMYLDPSEHFKNFDHSLTLARYSQSGMFVHRKVFETAETNIIEYVSKNMAADAREQSFERAKRKTVKYGGFWAYKGFKELIDA